jgi:hypothetical protein
MSVRRLGFIRLKLLMLRVYLLYLHTLIEGDEGKENTKPKSYDPVPYDEPHSAERHSGYDDSGNCR